MEPKELRQLQILIARSLDGMVTRREVEQLESMLLDSAQARACYREFLSVYCDLDSILNTDQQLSKKVMTDEVVLSNRFWSEMAEYEKNAPTVKIPQPKAEREKSTVVQPARLQQKISKFQLFTLVSSVAAILFIVLFVKLVPENIYSSEVATLIDQIDVQWGQNVNLKSGSRLWTNKGALELRKGIVKVAYDDGVDVLIEGPAVFEIERTGVYLDYGRLFSTVSDAGLGFTVKTPTSQFIDHGTEFGIQADINGSSELHVIKGKVQLFTDTETKARTGQMVMADHAVRYDSYSGSISDINVKENAFVRQIDSKKHIVWRGESLSLVNVVCGGNGFKGGKIKTGIEPASGQVFDVPRQNTDEEIPVGKYSPVKGNRFVDGVFVPNGDRGANQVTSIGDTFGGFPETNGSCYTDITGYPYIYEIQGVKSKTGSVEKVEIKLNPVSNDEDVMDTPSILVHANAGVTFDLDELRKANPGLAFEAFTAKCVSGSMWKKQSEFWVLVDGECVFHCLSEDARENKNNIINIPLDSSNTFLTLATTDGNDGKSYDWCLFMEPEIGLSKQLDENLNDLIN